ncbi:MAG: DUF4912 domain-containing protein, partial [Candidatus Krumholzibacteria bacterium]|nr:DUF4912 domain-containing protein [Candidatus Krumholzibacteria bacterium]
MTPKELDKMTKAQLLKHAMSKKISVATRMLKSDLIKAIQKESKAKKRKSTAKRAASRKAAVKSSKKIRTRKTATIRSAKVSGAQKTAKAKGAAGKKAAAQAPAAREKRMAARTIRQKAEAGKFYLGAEEGVMPPVDAMDIPAGYNTDRIAAMVRDPRWIFSYWEVTMERFRKLEKLFGREWSDCCMILRVLDKSSVAETHFDISINSDARNWYINVLPERRYQVSIGVLGPGGRFVEIAVSNIVETPREGTSNIIDDRWMVPEETFERIFAASGGYDMQDSSAELRELIERRLLEQVSSGAVSSFGSGALRKGEKD